MYEIVKKNKQKIMKLCILVKASTIVATIVFCRDEVRLEQIMRINVVEAIIFDVFVEQDYYNALFGFGVMQSFPYFARLNYDNNIGMKLWTILYAIWNVRLVCKDKRVTPSFIAALSHNLPALLVTLTSNGMTLHEITQAFSLSRCASILTYIMATYKQDLSDLITASPKTYSSLRTVIPASHT